MFLTCSSWNTTFFDKKKKKKKNFKQIRHIFKIIFNQKICCIINTVSFDLLRVRILLGDSAVTVTSEVAGLGQSTGD